jgi:gamma-glutamylcyclotransferase (GGCT)/AIG2-like uncharacterized protein YtfP
LTERLFVYGLLRKGERLAPFLGNARFVGAARVRGHDLLDLGSYPAAVPGEGTVVGEVYELDALDLLDEAEGVHEDPPLYRRVRVAALGAPAWMYVYARDPGAAPRIPSGDWLRR